MNKKLQYILEIIQQSEKMNAEQKDTLLKAVKDADKELEITAFKLERTEKVKKTTAILLEETIEELEQKRKAVEEQNRELEIEASLERVRTVAMGMSKSEDLLSICEVSFRELQKLGFDDLRNAVIHVHNDEQKYFMDYDFSDFTGGQIGKVEYGLHPIVDEYLEKIRSAEDAFFEVVIAEDMLEEWNEFRRKSGQMNDQRLDEADALYYYLFSIGIGDIGISTFKPIKDSQIKILKRFRNVFDLAYRRYNDIITAEAQAREAQIEAALERVRAKAMAMNSTEDLTQTADTFFSELVKLNITPHRCGIGIVDKETRTADIHAKTATEDKSFKIVTGKLKLDDHPILKKIFEGYEKQEEYHPVLRGKEISDYYKVMNPQVVFPDFSDDEVQYGYYFYFKEGGVFAWNDEEFTANELEIFRRYTSVLSLTYRRFIDLKDAEAQAKEAQIEAALERVRSRSMGMQKSEELKEVIRVVYEQLVQLNINIEHTGFIMDYKTRDDMHIWLADQNEVPSEIVIPYFDSPHWNSFIEAKANGKVFFANHLSFEEKNIFYQDLFQFIPGVPEETKEYYFSCPGLAISTVLLENVGLYIENFSGTPYSDEENKLLIRFGKVFEQTYTRFLDLHKAEAQARESEIELALERIRARTMAMQKSEDLADISFELVKQVQALGISTWFCAFNIYDDDPKGSLEWGSNAQGTYEEYRTPREGIFLRYYEAGQRGETLLINEIDEDECPRHYEYLCTLPGVGEQLLQMKDAGIPFPTSQIDHVAFFKYGYIIFITYEAVPEAYDIFKRFAKVFEQTYTRFLDLKNAEAQAREAKIQLSLERVRARSMAMHQTDELSDVLCVLLEQFDFLGIDPVLTHLTLFDEANEKFSLRLTTSPKKRILVEQIIDIHAVESWKASFENWKKAEPNTVDCIDYPSDVLPAVWEVLSVVMNALPEGYKINPKNFPNGLYTTQGHFKFGYIGFNHSRRATEEEKNIVSRFATEFGRVYQRFLDLKKAEAQTREAKIEAALERVRARAMGMHKSEEVGEVSDLLFSELNKLSLDLHGCSLVVIDEESDKMELWRARSNVAIKPFETTSVSKVMNILKKHLPDFFPKFQNAAGKRKGYLIDELSGKRRLQLINAITEQYNYSSSERSKLIKNAPENITTHYIFFKLGYLALLSENKLSDENLSITRRFVEVFEFSYTRFIDIKKAEEQAREAKIEASLEKVRSVALSLKKSDEMLNIAQVLYEQLLELGFKNIRNALIDIKNGDDDTFTDYDYSHEMSGTITQMSYHDDPTLQGQFKKMATTTDDFFELVLEGKELDDLKAMRIKNGEDEDPRLNSIDVLTYNLYSFGNGAIGISNFGVLSKEEKSILNRFSNVFTFAYKRYNDLVKSELQARETQIELSLERIRAQVTSMKESEEILEIVVKMRTEFVSLGYDAAYFWYMKWTPDKYLKAMTSGDGTRIGMVMELPRKIHAEIKNLADWEKSSEPLVVHVMDVDATLDYVHKMAAWGAFKQIDPNMPTVEDIRKMGGLTYVMARTMHGEIGYSIPGMVHDPPEEALSTLVRFAKVFDLAYKRFEDLKRSEQQFRESQIELGMERVRAKAMAMHSSADLSATVNVFFMELKTLGITPIRCGVGQIDEKTRTTNLTTTTSAQQGKSFEVRGKVKQTGHPVLDGIFENWKIQKDYFPVLEGAEIKNYYSVMNKQIPYPDYSEDITQYGNMFYFKEGFVFAWTENKLSEEELQIFRRFTSVLSLTYTRYIDLQQAELRAREAEQQASLDRVRGEIASMRTTEDLEKITPLIWRELTNLNIKFFRCGVFIIDESTEVVKVYLTTPSGKSLAALHLPFNSSQLVKQSVKFWKEHKVYKEQWNREQFIAWARSLVEQGHIKDTKEYRGGEKPPELLSLHFIPFEQGMLYVGSAAKLTDEEIKTAQKLADSFGVAYARYEDFQKLEAANHRKSLELEEARQLQLAMLPKELPQLPNLDIAVYMQTATEVGGDYYDFNVGENGELTAVIGDATGHGMKAGTIVTITKSLFNSLASSKNILDTFTKISKVIKDMKFRQLAMCLMMLKIHKNKIIISSAAMPPALIFRKKKNLVEEIELKGMPLGAMENFPYEIKNTSINSGDTILLMSDGLPELHNGTNKMYGYDRIINEFNSVGNNAPEKIIDHLKKSAAAWINGNDPDDDITFVVIKVK